MNGGNEAALFPYRKRLPVWISEMSARAHVRFHGVQRNGLVKPPL